MRRRQKYALANQAARKAALVPVADIVLGPASMDSDISNVLNACRKCGRVLPRGKFMHEKHCKGA